MAPALGPHSFAPRFRVRLPQFAPRRVSHRRLTRRFVPAVRHKKACGPGIPRYTHALQMNCIRRGGIP